MLEGRNLGVSQPSTSLSHSLPLVQTSLTPPLFISLPTSPSSLLLSVDTRSMHIFLQKFLAVNQFHLACLMTSSEESQERKKDFPQRSLCPDFSFTSWIHLCSLGISYSIPGDPIPSKGLVVVV